jgi:hypothetical protein
VAQVLPSRQRIKILPAHKLSITLVLLIPNVSISVSLSLQGFARVLQGYCEGIEFRNGDIFHMLVRSLRGLRGFLGGIRVSHCSADGWRNARGRAPRAPHIHARIGRQNPRNPRKTCANVLIKQKKSDREGFEKASQNPRDPRYLFSNSRRPIFRNRHSRLPRLLTVTTNREGACPAARRASGRRAV